MLEPIDINRFADSLFHAYDIRIDAKEFDDDMALRLCDAQAYYFKYVLQAESLVLSRDVRKSGSHYLQLAIDRFSQLGFELYVDILPVSTCQFYYSCRTRPQCAGIMYSASHNPGYYTGQKIVGKDCEPIAENIGPEMGLSRIKELFLQGASLSDAERCGKIHYFSDSDNYVRWAMEYADVTPGQLSGVTVVADFLSGTASNEILKGLQRAGVNLIARNQIPDGEFPCGTPNPVIRDSVLPTITFLKAFKQYDFCFCFDGDGDRMDILIQGETNISPSFVMAFLAPQLLELYPEATTPMIGLDSKANPYAETLLSEKGIASLIVPTGHSKIKGLLQQYATEGLLAAVEETAHYYFNYISPETGTVPTESTLFFCLLFIKAWKQDGKRLQDIVNLQKQTYSLREWGYTYAQEKDLKQAMENVKNHFLASGYKITTKTKNGISLGGAIFSTGHVNSDGHWARITQRESESERGVARWSVSASQANLVARIAQEIDAMASINAITSYRG